MWNHWVVVGRLPSCISDPKNWQLWRFVICPSCLFTSFNTCSILERSTPLPPLLETKTRADRFTTCDTEINHLSLFWLIVLMFSLIQMSLQIYLETSVEMSHSLTLIFPHGYKTCRYTFVLTLCPSTWLDLCSDCTCMYTVTRPRCKLCGESEWVTNDKSSVCSFF